jgi:hypothetical protein
VLILVCLDKIYADSNKLKKFFKIILKYLSQKSGLNLSELNLGLDIDIDEEIYPSWKDIVEHLRIYKNYYIGLKSEKIHLNEEKIYLSTDIQKEEDVIKNIIDFDNKVKLNLEKVHNITELYQIKCNKNMEALNKMVAFVDVIHSHNISNIEKMHYITSDSNYTHEHVLEVLTLRKLNNTVNQLEVKLQPEKISIQVAGKKININTQNKNLNGVNIENLNTKSLIDYNVTHSLPEKIVTPLDSHLTDHSFQAKLEDRNEIHSVTKDFSLAASNNSTLEIHSFSHPLPKIIETPKIQPSLNNQVPLINNKNDQKSGSPFIEKTSDTLDWDDDMDMMDDDDKTGNLLMENSKTLNLNSKSENKTIYNERIIKRSSTDKIGEPSIGKNSEKILPSSKIQLNSLNNNLETFKKNQIPIQAKRIHEPSLRAEGKVQTTKSTGASPPSLENYNNKLTQNQVNNMNNILNIKNKANQNSQMNLQNFRNTEQNNNLINSSSLSNQNELIKNNPSVNQHQIPNVINNQTPNMIKNIHFNTFSAPNLHPQVPLSNLKINQIPIPVQTRVPVPTPSLHLHVPTPLTPNPIIPPSPQIQNLSNSNLPIISQALPLKITAVKVAQTPDDFNKNVFKPNQKIENLVNNILGVDNKQKLNEPTVVPTVINPSSVNNLEKLLNGGKSPILPSADNSKEKQENLNKNVQSSRAPVSTQAASSTPPLRKMNKEDDDDDMMSDEEDDKAFLQKRANISLLDAELGIKQNEKLLNNNKIAKLSVEEIKRSAKKFMEQLKHEIHEYKKEVKINQKNQHEESNFNSSKSSIFQEDNKSLKHLSETSNNLVNLLSNNLKSLDDEFFKVKHNIISSLIK